MNEKNKNMNLKRKKINGKENQNSMIDFFNTYQQILMNKLKTKLFMNNPALTKEIQILTYCLV